MIFKVPYMYLVQNNVYRVNHDNSPPPWGDFDRQNKGGGAYTVAGDLSQNLPETAQES